MAGIDLGGVSSWLIAAVLGLGILWAVNKGLVKSQYSLADISIPMDNLGLIIFLLALILGAFYFFTDVSRKI